MQPATGKTTPPQPHFRVVLVQRLPPEVSVEDVIHHAAKVGNVTGRFVQEKTRHVFVEMETQQQAQSLVNALGSIHVKGHQLRAELSSRYAQVAEEKVNKVLVLSLPGLAEGATDCHQLATLFNSKGGQVRKIQLWNKDGVVQGLVEMDTNQSAQVLREQLSGYVMGTATVRLSYSNKPSIELKQLQHGFDFVTNEGGGMCPRVPGIGMGGFQGRHLDPHAFGMQGLHDEAGGPVCVVLVKNILEGTTPEALFRLFGICGDVKAVKVTFKKRSTALVEYDNSRGAYKACQLLHDCPFYEEDRHLEVYPAKVDHITGRPDELTKFYHDSVHHRFSGRSAQKNLENMHGPNSQLHVSNVPVSIPNETVELALRDYSDNCTTRWIENKATNEARTKMCIASMDSVRSAVAALIGLHTIYFNRHAPQNGKGIVVSFCKRPPQARPSTVLKPSLAPSSNGVIPDPTRPHHEAEMQNLRRGLSDHRQGPPATQASQYLPEEFHTPSLPPPP